MTGRGTIWKQIEMLLDWNIVKTQRKFYKSYLNYMRQKKPLVSLWVTEWRTNRFIEKLPKNRSWSQSRNTIMISWRRRFKIRVDPDLTLKKDRIRSLKKADPILKKQPGSGLDLIEYALNFFLSISRNNSRHWIQCLLI